MLRMCEKIYRNMNSSNFTDKHFKNLKFKKILINENLAFFFMSILDMYCTKKNCS